MRLCMRMLKGWGRGYMIVNLVYREIKKKKRRGEVKFVTREDEGIK